MHGNEWPGARDLAAHLGVVRRLPRRPPPDGLRALPTGVEGLREGGIGTRLHALQPQTCDRILDECAQLLRDGDFTTDVEKLSNAKRRFDVNLPPRGYCWEVLQRILRAWKDDPHSPWHTFRQRGVTPRLVEFSLLGSLPGARGQAWHTDHAAGRGKLISFGIPMLDVQPEHGPLQCIPFGLPDAYYKRHPFLVCGQKGEMFAWDGAMRHRGGANASDVARPLFMFSLCFAERIPNGKDEQSLHPELRARLV